MMQTLEAVGNETGEVKLLTIVHLPERRRALATILEEAPKVAAVSTKEKLRTVLSKMHQIEMFRGIKDISAWQRNRRAEWE